MHDTADLDKVYSVLDFRGYADQGWTRSSSSGFARTAPTPSWRASARSSCGCRTAATARCADARRASHLRSVPQRSRPVQVPAPRRTGGCARSAASASSSATASGRSRQYLPEMERIFREEGLPGRADAHSRSSSRASTSTPTRRWVRPASGSSCRRPGASSWRSATPSTSAATRSRRRVRRRATSRAPTSASAAGRSRSRRTTTARTACRARVDATGSDRHRLDRQVLRRTGLRLRVAQLLRRVPRRARHRPEPGRVLRTVAAGSGPRDAHRDARSADRHLHGRAARAHRSLRDRGHESRAARSRRVGPRIDSRRVRAPLPADSTDGFAGSARAVRARHPGRARRARRPAGSRGERSARRPGRHARRGDAPGASRADAHRTSPSDYGVIGRRRCGLANRLGRPRPACARAGPADPAS